MAIIIVDDEIRTQLWQLKIDHKLKTHNQAVQYLLNEVKQHETTNQG